MLPCEHPARDQIQIRCCSLYLSFTIGNVKQHVFARGFFASEPSPIRLVAPSRSPRKWSDHHRSADAKAAVSCSTDPGDGWIEKIRLDRRQQLFRKRRTISERPRRRTAESPNKPQQITGLTQLAYPAAAISRSH